MGKQQINFTRGLLRLWMIFTIVWIVVFAGIAVKNFYQGIWVTHQQDLERYRQTLVDNAELKNNDVMDQRPAKGVPSTP